MSEGLEFLLSSRYLSDTFDVYIIRTLINTAERAESTPPKSGVGVQLNQHRRHRQHDFGSARQHDSITPQAHRTDTQHDFAVMRIGQIDANVVKPVSVRCA